MREPNSQAARRQCERAGTPARMGSLARTSTGPWVKEGVGGDWRIRAVGTGRCGPTGLASSARHSLAILATLVAPHVGRSGVRVAGHDQGPHEEERRVEDHDEGRGQTDGCGREKR